MATGIGKVVLDISRDRNGTVDSMLIAKYQRRLPKFDRKIDRIYVRGMTIREIQSHLEGIHGAEASHGLISAIAGTVMDGVAA